VNKIIGKNSQSGGKKIKSKTYKVQKNATWTYEGKLAVITDSVHGMEFKL
jgi:hypothetical protein